MQPSAEQVIERQPCRAPDALQALTPRADDNRFLPLAIDPNGRIDGQLAILFDHVFHFHRHPVGHFLIQLECELLADQLGHPEFEAAVRDLAIEKHGGGHREVPGDGLLQVLHVVALQCADRHDRQEVMACRQLRNVGQQPIAGLRAIDLVHRSDRRPPGLDDASKGEIVFRGPAQPFDDDYHQIRILQRGGRRPVHRPIQRARGVTVQPRGIDEGDLRRRQIGYADDPVARGLGTGCDDAHFLSNQGVQQRRLADVRPADQRGEPASKFICHGVSMSCRIRSAASCSARLRLRPLPCACRPRSSTSQVTWNVCACASPSIRSTT